MHQRSTKTRQTRGLHKLKKSPKELTNIIKVYDATSTMTALVNTFHKKVRYHDFRDMHKGVINEIESMKQPKKKSEL
jgi:hypothetical protein